MRIEFYDNDPRITGLALGNPQATDWLPLQKASSAEQRTAEQTVQMPMISCGAMTPIWYHCHQM